MEQVILVDEKDNEKGLMEKMEAHQKGLLHRAFSVFVFNSQNELLLQKRAINKYHSGGLWTNTCCSHPRKGESVEEAAHRRLKEEMGFDCDLKKAFEFIYKKKLDKGLTEHELDHVFIGHYNISPEINTQEVSEWKYISIKEIDNELTQRPEQYTEWFKICYKEVLTHLKLI